MRTVVDFDACTGTQFQKPIKSMAAGIIIGDENEPAIERSGEEIVMRETSASSSIPTKILVPIDFSDSSHAALVTAAELAQHFQAEILLVHIVPMFPRTTFPDFMPETKFLESVRKEAERQFDACQADLGSKGIKASLCIEEGNDEGDQAVEHSADEHSQGPKDEHETSTLSRGWP